MNSYPVMNLWNHGLGQQRRFTRPGFSRPQPSIYGAKCHICPDGSYRMLSDFDAGQLANAGCKPTGQRQCPPPPRPSVATPSGRGAEIYGAKCYTCPDGSQRMLSPFDAGQPQNAGCKPGCAPQPAPTPVATPGAGGGAPGVACYECPDGSVSMMDSAVAAARGCIASNAPGCVPPVRPGVATPPAGAGFVGVAKCYKCPDGSQRWLNDFDAQQQGCKERCPEPQRPDVATIDRYIRETSQAPSPQPTGGYYGVAMPGGVFGLTGPMLPQVRLVSRRW